MREIQLRKFAVAGVFIMLAVMGLSYFTDILPYDVAGASEFAVSDETQAGNVQHTDYAYKKENSGSTPQITEPKPEDTGDENNQDVTNVRDGENIQNVQDVSQETPDPACAHVIIPKVSGESTLDFEDIYINRQIRLTVNNSLHDAYRKDMILYDNDVVKDIKIKENKPGGQVEAVTTVITLELDGVYEYRVHEENNQYIIDMMDIHSVYDKVIVIDAGHGGGDIGCGSNNLKHYEKDIDLSIVKSLKKKLDNTDIKVYYTRLKDETVYLRPRVTLANDVKADMFISVHCNYYDRYWRYTVNGAETLYSSKNKNMKGMSKKLADIMLNNYTGTSSIRKRGVIDRKKELYILKKSRVPSTIVELGYMSDKNDLKCLTDSNKRKKIVDGLYNGIVDAYASMYGKTVSDGA